MHLLLVVVLLYFSPALASLADLIQCLARADVSIVTNGSTDWDKTRKPFNLRFSWIQPQVIVEPASEADVVKAVNCSRDSGAAVCVLRSFSSLPTFADHS